MNIYISYQGNLESFTNDLKSLFEKNSYNIQNQIQSNTNFILYFKQGNDIEIIYPLQNNDNLAKQLSEKINATKYYQKRSSTNTSQNEDNLFNQLNDFQGLIIQLPSNIINNQTAKIIFDTINDFLINKNIYIVKSGDSLYSIARKFNTTVDELKGINNLTSNTLSINQKLIIPQTNENQSNDSQNNIYIVQSGDSLYSISKKFNTTVDELKRINNLSSNTLSINQRLLIPQANENQNSNQNNSIYIVKSGDSLYSIAKRFNTTVDELKRINNLSSNNLSINQKLILPNKNIYIVKKGDSLYSIARNFNTSVDELKKINNLSTNTLSINQELIIP